MPEPIRSLYAQLLTLWGGFSRLQRLAVLGLLGVTGIALAALAFWGRNVDYATLYGNLTPGDAGAIVEQLKGARVPFRLEDGGARILVPSAQVHEARIKLATAGLPQGGGVGFELFDRTSFGVTDFVQKLNYQRALQGELARSISQLREVQQARVHIVLPQPSVYSGAEKSPTASVVLGLRPGARLSPEQVRGIIHLVSGSVEGLAAERVTVIDSAGRLLSQRTDRPGAAGADSHFEHQLAVEAELQRRVQSMLEEVLGPGKTSVRVAAEVEFSHGERTEERIDPNSVVKSESRTTENSRGSNSRPSGVPGTGSNLAGAPAAGSGTSSTNESVKEQESIQYEVGRVVERRTLVAGDVKRLSVAVLVDPPYKVTPGPSGDKQKVPVPRSKPEMEKLRAMVMRAVGFNPSRGDEVEVAELAFDTSAVDRERVQAERAERNVFWWSLAKPIVYGLLLVLTLFFGLRPLLAHLRRRPAPAGVALDIQEPALSDADVAAHLTAKGMAALNPGQLLKAREREGLQGKISELADKDPERMAQLLRTWMLKRRA